MKSYARFALMILVSTILMMGLMYLNTNELDHVFFSQTRAFMALIMGSAMAVTMLAFMRSMYRNKAANAGIVIGSLAVFALALWLVRSQQTVGDVAWMKAMIPHHSIAILTSEHAKISDPRVLDLAHRITETQKREIEEMKGLIGDLEKRQH